MKIAVEKIKEERQKRGWTQQHLADVCQLNMRTIQRIEGMGVASPDSVQILCAVLEIKSEDLILFKRPNGPGSENLSPAKYHLKMIITGLGGFAAGITVTILLLKAL